MLIKFDEIREAVVPNYYGGEDLISVKMLSNASGKVMINRLPKGSSVGSHKHESSSEVNYVLRGTGVSVCDGEEEQLTAGCCCICPLNSTHSFENTGDEDLELFTVVIEEK